MVANYEDSAINPNTITDGPQEITREDTQKLPDAKVNKCFLYSMMIFVSLSAFLYGYMVS